MAKPCKHPDTMPGCRVCYLASTDSRYAEIWELPPPTEAPVGAPALWKQKLARLNSCKHRGGPMGALAPCGQCGAQGKSLPVLGCSVFGRCTELVAADRSLASCHGCERKEPPELRFIRTVDLTQASIQLAALLPAQVTAVVGLPRSGMLPAGIIATHLYLPLWQLTDEGKLERLGHGSRGRTLGFKTPRQEVFVVIDDTVYSGAAMQRARDFMKALHQTSLFAAVFARPDGRSAVDFYTRELLCPHLLEWNIFNCGMTWGNAANKAFFQEGIATDMDGVLCHDEESAGVPGAPYLLPRTGPGVPLIITGRAESHRAGTELWLRKHSCRYGKLLMRPDHIPDVWDAIAQFKAEHFGPSPYGLFVESNEQQARRIAELTGKPCVHPLTGKVFQ